MSVFTANLQEYAVLAHRILRDELPPAKIDAICFFGQTCENDEGPIVAIAQLWKKFRCPVLIGQCDPIRKGGFVVRGSHAWGAALITDFDVTMKDVIVYPMSDKFPPSTDAEAWGMVEVIKKNSWSRLVVTVPPLHAIRAFVSLVSACRKNNLDNVNVWSAPSNAPPWNENVFHSGSMPAAPRTEQVVGEFNKISRYCEKGDHLTAGEVLAYLKSRTET